MRIIGAAAVALAVAAVTAAPGASQSQSVGDVPAASGGVERASRPDVVRVERTAWLMGTRAEILVDADDRSDALAASEAALAAMATVEARLSTWRADTDLARINRAPPATPTPAPEPLAGLLAEVARWIGRTEGAFHPAVGALVDAWDLRGEGRLPTADELRDALDASGELGVEIDPTSGSVVRHDADAWLDAGGFGKGAALREVRDLLASASIRSARVDLGGQILAVGTAPAEVLVAHPARRDHPLRAFDLSHASVATSGQSERGIEIGGERYGHLLDPRTGRPVPAWGSVTVVHDDPLVADILATALFVLGPDEGLALAESLGGVAALFLVATDAAATGGTVTERMTTAMRTRYPLRSLEASTQH